MNLLSKTLNNIRISKLEAIESQKFELASVLRDIERTIEKHKYGVTTYSELMWSLCGLSQIYYKKNVIIILPLIRRFKLDEINLILKPYIRRDKIRKIENVL